MCCIIATLPRTVALYYTTDTLNFVMKKNYKEKDFYRYLKDNLKGISLVRIENTALLGTPDIFAINSSYNWFPIELKVIKGNSKPRFSPHQISFHVKHTKNAFIFIKQKTLVASCYKLYPSTSILTLVSCGVKNLTPVACDLDACALFLENI